MERGGRKRVRKEKKGREEGLKGLWEERRKKERKEKKEMRVKFCERAYT